MKKAVAVVGSSHVCPMVTGNVPHVGGPIIGPGASSVFIDGQPVAVVGDMCTCSGPPDTIVTGFPGVLINGKPIAVVGSLTAHGGQIVSGIPGVVVSSVTPEKPAVMPLKKIKFPEIDLLSKLLSPKKAKNAKEKIAEVKAVVEQEDDKDPNIFNVQWRHDSNVIRNSKQCAKVIVTADTSGIDNGTTVTFEISIPDKDGEAERMETVTGTVTDDYIEAEWYIEDILDKQDDAGNQQNN